MRKCSACGSEKLAPYVCLIGDANLQAEATVCIYCHHIDLWGTGRELEYALKQRELDEKRIIAMKELNDKLEAYQKELPILQQKIVKLKNECNVLESESNNDDITVKQQKELLTQVAQKEDEIRLIEKSIRNINTFIERDYSIECEKINRLSV